MKADLPIVYRKCSAYFAAFPYPLSAIRPLMPHPMLAPVPLGFRGKGALVVAVFDYQETSIGPYREVGIGFQCRLRTSGPIPLLPLLFEPLFEDVGSFVHLLPVTTQIAEEAGKKHWGYPKFIADIRIDRTDDGMKCEVLENGQRLMGIEIHRPAPPQTFGLPLRTYSVLGDELLFTQLHIDAFGAVRRRSLAAHVEISDHLRMRDLDARALNGAKPLEVRWFDDYRTLLDRPSARYRLSA